MNQLAFYPGCALQSMSWDYRESIVQTASALDLDLVEIEDWTCCGASAAHSLDERMSVILPARNLAGAQALGRDLAVACPMCFKRLSHSRQVLLEQKVDDPYSLNPDLAVMDLARLLASEPMLSRIRERIEAPLTGLRVVCYYGCQVVRPPKITSYTDYENPRHLDLLVKALGATPIDWSFKAVCCGASLGIPKREIGASLVNRLISQARASGAHAIVVCCPLCHGNLDLFQPQPSRQNGGNGNGKRRGGGGGCEEPLPILYYTELLGLAFGVDSIRAALKSHLVDPLPLIERVLGH
jgi:heterodisulfide reductase subunit B